MCTQCIKVELSLHGCLLLLYSLTHSLLFFHPNVALLNMEHHNVNDSETTNGCSSSQCYLQQGCRYVIQFVNHPSQIQFLNQSSNDMVKVLLAASYFNSNIFYKLPRLIETSIIFSQLAPSCTSINLATNITFNKMGRQTPVFSKTSSINVSWNKNSMFGPQ